MRILRVNSKIAYLTIRPKSEAVKVLVKENPTLPASVMTIGEERGVILNKKMNHVA